MHYHIMINSGYRPSVFPDWYNGKTFRLLPEVVGVVLETSSLSCAMQDGLVVAKPDGEKTSRVLVNNNGGHRDMTGRQLADFLVTCKKKGDTVSVDEKVESNFLGKEIVTQLEKLFGQDGYAISSAHQPDASYLRTALPKLKGQGIERVFPR